MGLDCLPDEIIWNIFSKVPTLDLIRVQCVCKRWKCIVEEPSFRQLQSSCSTSNPNNRFIMLPQHDKVFFVGLPDIDIDKTTIFKRELEYPIFAKYGPLKSHNGLLCYEYEFKRIIVVNPFTNQHALLPEVNDAEIRYIFEVCGFLFNPTTNFYKVMVLVFRELPHPSEFMIFNSGSNRWRSMGEPPSFNITTRSLQVLVKERLHWMAPVQHPGWDIIVSFDLINETFSTIRLPPVDSLVKEHVQLMAFDGKLCILMNYVLGQTFHQRIWVMEEYGVEESWANKFNAQYTITFEALPPGGLFIDLVGELNNGKVLLQTNQGTFFFNDLRNQDYRSLQSSRLPIKTLEEKWSQVLPINTQDMFTSIHFASLCSITS